MNVLLLARAGRERNQFTLFLSLAFPTDRGRHNRIWCVPSTGCLVGFRGAYELLEATGEDVGYLRGDNFEETGLLIVTLEQRINREQLAAIISQDYAAPLLIILPKWTTLPLDTQRDRVQTLGPEAGRAGVALLTELGNFRVEIGDTEAGERLLTSTAAQTEFRAPAALQTIAGKDLEGIIETSASEIVLAEVAESGIYILADPDLLNNQALASPQRAQAALALLRDLNYDGGPYRFDLVVNGFAGARNLLTLAFEPPFLALTLCILAAALLAGLYALHRFGPALREQRAIAFGKRALVENSAELLRVARREHLSSERYVAMTREAAVSAIGNPRQLHGPALDEWLDGLGPATTPSFTALAERAERAKSRTEILDAARALYSWRKAVTHEG
jgi:hypothetical protein